MDAVNGFDKVGDLTRYMRSMLAAVATGSLGEQSRCNALEQIKDHLAVLDGMRSRAGFLQSEVELLFPHVCGAGMFEKVIV